MVESQIQMEEALLFYFVNILILNEYQKWVQYLTLKEDIPTVYWYGSKHPNSKMPNVKPKLNFGKICYIIKIRKV